MILCLGTTPTVQRTMFLDRLQVDSVNRARKVVETASGKSLNVARVLATLGKACVALGFAGGATGDFLREDLDRAGIAHDLVRVQAKTRTCVTILDESSGAATELVEESREVEAAAWDVLRERVVARLAEAKMLVCSGSLPPGADVGFYGWCVTEAAKRGVQCVLDASGPPLLEALAAKPAVVKPNRSELAKTIGRDVEERIGMKSAILELMAQGPQAAIVTMGKQGAIVCDGRGFWSIPAQAIRAVSAIGSGDAFAAGVAAGLVDGQSLLEAARFGAACAAANAMVPVAGFLRLDDVHALLPQIKPVEI